MYRSLAVWLVCFAALPVIHAQKQPPPDLRFDVASLKPSAPGGRGGGIRPGPGGQSYLANNVTLRGMLTIAYRLKAEQVTGGPAWLGTDRFDMDAKAERPSSVEELHVMLANLLADRFQLRFHKETKEMPVFVLSVDKTGPKLTPHDARNSGEPWIDVAVEGLLKNKWKGVFCPMDYFAWRLGQILDRPVVDRTNLSGGFDFTLDFTRELPPNIPENAQINGAPIDTSGPTLFEAVQKQLGLRLERQKAPAEIMVIDSVEKPSAN